MFHKIKNVVALPEYQLSVQFVEGETKIYDAAHLVRSFEPFAYFQEHPEAFENVYVDVGGHGIIWNDDLDLSCDELWDNGTRVDTPFDGLIAFSEATELWGLNEGTLRKAASYGKLIEGIDACKFGKQWVISRDAMIREYGVPAESANTTSSRNY